jgi:hypothetical protein
VKTCFSVLGFITAAVVGIVIVVSLLAANSTTRGQGGTTPGHDDIGAWVVCEDFVRDSLKAPASAKFAEGHTDNYVTANGGGKYTVKAYVDAQNSFGAMLRMNFTCVVKGTGNQNYTLVDLDLQEQ